MSEISGGWCSRSHPLVGQSILGALRARSSWKLLKLLQQEYGPEGMMEIASLFFCVGCVFRVVRVTGEHIFLGCLCISLRDLELQ